MTKEELTDNECDVLFKRILEMVRDGDKMFMMIDEEVIQDLVDNKYIYRFN